MVAKQAPRPAAIDRATGTLLVPLFRDFVYTVRVNTVVLYIIILRIDFDKCCFGFGNLLPESILVLTDFVDRHEWTH